MCTTSDCTSAAVYPNFTPARFISRSYCHWICQGPWRSTSLYGTLPVTWGRVEGAPRTFVFARPSVVALRYGAQHPSSHIESIEFTIVNAHYEPYPSVVAPMHATSMSMRPPLGSIALEICQSGLGPDPRVYAGPKAGMSLCTRIPGREDLHGLVRSLGSIHSPLAPPVCLFDRLTDVLRSIAQAQPSSD